MVKPPKIRHSKTHRDPVTIDLDPTDVKREEGREKPSATAAPKAPDTAGKASPTAASGQSAVPETRAAKPDATAAKQETADRPTAKPAPGTSFAGSSATAASNEKASDEKPGSAAAAASVGTAARAADRSEPEKTTATSGSSAEPAKPGGARAEPAKAGAATGSGAEPPKSSGAIPGQPPAFGRGAQAGPQKAERKDEPGPAPAPPRRDTSRRGGVSAIAAGIIGGAVALIGAGGLQYAGVFPSFGTTGPGPADASGLAELRSQVEVLRQEIATAAATDDTSADTARMDELASALEQVRSEVAALRAAGPTEGGAGTEALQARLDELESTVATLQGGQAGASPEELSSLSERVGTLAERVGSIEERVTGASDTANAAQTAVSGLPDRLASLEARFQTLSEQVEAQASDTGAALAIAAAGLKAAIDRGTPFMTELETFAAVAPDAPEIAALRELAASGVPTRAAISARVDEVAARMIAAGAPANEGAGYLDRLLDSMASLVTVRPIGEVEGEGVGPGVARMEAAIEAGDYPRAISEYESLPEPVKAAGADFIADVRARQGADDLVATALAAALRA